MNMMNYGSGFMGADPSQYGGAGQGYGGYSPYSMGGSPMGYGYGGFGGYNPFGFYGGQQGGAFGYGGYGGGGMWGGQQAPQQFDFSAMMQPYLDSYFSQLSTNSTTAPTTGATTDGTTAETTVTANTTAPAAPAQDRTFNSVMRGGGGQYETTGAGQNFGANYLRTGQFGAKGLEAIKRMGYADQDAYLAANSGLVSRKNVYDRKHPNQTQPNSMGHTVQNGKATDKPSPNTL